jgi:Leucine-rich repeat (LRR) protein/predicted DNA-binding WGR domain protein
MLRALMKRTLEFSEGTSNKFWEVWCEGAVIHTRFGKIGAEGQTTLKKCSSPAVAELLAAGLAAQKLKKGYVEKAAKAPEPAPAPKKKEPKLTPFVLRLKNDPALRAALGKTDFAPDDVNDLEQWSELEAATTKDRTLFVAEWTPLVDLSWVVDFPKLTHVSIGISAKTDLRPLGKLAALESLKLIDEKQGAKVDLSFLAGLTKLKELELRGAAVKSLAPLKALRSLEVLVADRGEVDDLSPLAGLTKLRRLFLPGHRLTSLAPLAKLTALTYLQVPDNRVSDVAPLAKLTKLRFLGLKGNRVGDVSALSGLTALETMYLEGNPVTDTSALKNAKALRTKDFTIKAGARPTLPPELKARLTALAETKPCEQLLAKLLTRVRGVSSSKKSTVVQFDCDDHDVVALELTAPFKGQVSAPPSFARLVTKVGARVAVDPRDGGMGGPRLAVSSKGAVEAYCEWEGDEDRARFSELCSAGQNFFVWDAKAKNKAGEPGIVFFSHEGALDPKQRFPEQDKVPFGVGGFVLRALAYRVFSKDPAWRGCGWG